MKFDDYMTACLHEAAAHVTPDPALRTRVLARAGSGRIRAPRKALIAAALVCLTLGTALAAGPAAYLISGIPSSEITSTDQLNKLEKKLGYDVQLPETMHGLTFDNACALPWNLKDGADNQVGSFLAMNASYTGGGSRVSLDAELSQADAPAQGAGLSDTTLVETRALDGIAVTYRQIPTIIVPPSEADSFTDEERAAEARGEMFLSVGSEVREESVYHTISWTQDGVRYSISAFDGSTDWTADDFFAAVQDVMNA